MAPDPVGRSESASSTASGAVWWDSPMTSRLTTATADPEVPGGERLALGVEGEDLQLGREVDAAHVDARRHGQHGRARS